MLCKKYSSVLSGAECSLSSRLRKFVGATGYPIYDLKYLRKIGPPTNSKSAPTRGCEVFVNQLPVDAFEDEIFWFFRSAGEIYDIRLMVRPSGLANRGFAFVRYKTPEEAQNAIKVLGQQELRPGHKVCVKKSAENNRLFIHGVPLDKTKAEIWDELIRNGMDNIVDVIVYKSYYKRATNRGFAFIEFGTHEEAATMRRKYNKEMRLCLWKTPFRFEWSKPVVEAEPDVMKAVTRVFMRNLQISMTKVEFVTRLQTIVNINTVVKVYKKKNYSFVHFNTREAAEEGLQKLQNYYRGTDVEVIWSIPPSVAKKRTRALPPRFNGGSKHKAATSGRRSCRKTGMAEVCPSSSQYQRGAHDKVQQTAQSFFQESPTAWASLLLEEKKSSTDYQLKDVTYNGLKERDNIWGLWDAASASNANTSYGNSTEKCSSNQEGAEFVFSNEEDEMLDAALPMHLLEKCAAEILE